MTLSQKPWPISLIVLAIWVVIVLAGELLQVRGQPTALEELARTQIIFGVVVAALFLVAVITYLKWWPQVGGKGPDQVSDFRLLWLPALALLILLLIVLLIGLPPPQVLVIVVVNTLLVGISEELMFRGVLFHGASSSFSIWRTVWITAILFGLVHALNGFITGSFIAAVIQALLAGMAGVWMVALRIRLKTIIPLIIIHWLWDCLLFMTSFLGGLVVLPFAVVLFIYGLWLLRGYRHGHKTAGET
jgi:membrane protease YdiL (CAAX protease family)